MLRHLALALIVGSMLAACGATSNPEPSRMRSCDDGGSGGVVIDGVCL